MKKILFILTLSAVSVFAGSIVIAKSKSFSLSKMPKKVVSSFSISQQNDDISVIETGFSENNKIVEKSGICKGGSYRINPLYRWENDQKVFLGYEGHISYECSFKEYEKYSLLTKKVVLKDQKIRLGTLRWSLEDVQIDELEKQLEKDVFAYAKEYLSFLEEQTGKECDISKINLAGQRMYQPRAVSLEAKGAAPIKEEQSVSKNADYEFVCK